MTTATPAPQAPKTKESEAPKPEYALRDRSVGRSAFTARYRGYPMPFTETEFNDATEEYKTTQKRGLTALSTVKVADQALSAGASAAVTAATRDHLNELAEINNQMSNQILEAIKDQGRGYELAYVNGNPIPGKGVDPDTTLKRFQKIEEFATKKLEKKQKEFKAKLANQLKTATAPAFSEAEQDAILAKLDETHKQQKENIKGYFNKLLHAQTKVQKYKNKELAMGGLAEADPSAVTTLITENDLVLDITDVNRNPKLGFKDDPNFKERYKLNDATVWERPSGAKIKRDNFGSYHIQGFPKDEDIRHMLLLMKANDCSSIRLSGNTGFMRQAWLIASTMGFEVDVNYEGSKWHPEQSDFDHLDEMVNGLGSFKTTEKGLQDLEQATQKANDARDIIKSLSSTLTTSDKLESKARALATLPADPKGKILTLTATQGLLKETVKDLETLVAQRKILAEQAKARIKLLQTYKPSKESNAVIPLLATDAVKGIIVTNMDKGSWKRTPLLGSETTFVGGTKTGDKALSALGWIIKGPLMLIRLKYPEWAEKKLKSIQVATSKGLTSGSFSPDELSPGEQQRIAQLCHEEQLKELRRDLQAIEELDDQIEETSTAAKNLRQELNTTLEDGRVKTALNQGETQAEYAELVKENKTLETTLKKIDDDLLDAQTQADLNLNTMSTNLTNLERDYLTARGLPVPPDQSQTTSLTQTLRNNPT